jgi:hypothetical protein
VLLLRGSFQGSGENNGLVLRVTETCGGRDMQRKRRINHNDGTDSVGSERLDSNRVVGRWGYMVKGEGNFQ